VQDLQDRVDLMKKDLDEYLPTHWF
jgi:hypothetical protein